MENPRENFLKKVSTMLIGKVNDQVATLVNAVVRVAAESYEITGRCTELVTTDDMNEEILESYRLSLIIEGKREKTIEHYMYQLEKIGRMIQKDFRKVTTGDLKLYMAKRTAAGIAARTVDNERAALSAFYEWMLNEDLIEKDPTGKIKKIRYQRKEEKPFTQQEVARIRDTAENRERAMVEFLLATGVRVTELIKMEKTDIRDDMTVTVREGKGGKYRVTYITPTAMMYLKKYMNTRKDNDPHLFISKTSVSALSDDGIREILHGLEEESGVQNIHPHRFRHTFATELANRGVPVTTIQKLLGHASLNTTMGYINQAAEKARQDYERAI